ncbi:MAG: HAMP domain-containing sensor histidine kinase, partial [Acetobacteraceae bacterium]
GNGASPCRGHVMHSLRSRLFVLWALALAACVVVGLRLVQFYRQSTSAQVQRAEAVVARSCDVIGDRYRFYATGWSGPPNGEIDATVRSGLRAVVSVALARQPGIEGGLWQKGTGSLAYAYPTYEGTGPKTDLPTAEFDRIQATNVQAAREDQPVLSRSEARTQTRLLYACPIGGPIAGLTGWTMTRVEATPGYDRLRAGLGVLLALMFGMAGWLTWLVAAWSRHVARLEIALAAQADGQLPPLRPTGERELDRIIGALNEAGVRLAEARRRSDELTLRMAAAERLAALGRVAAGIAHEIRNPIAAMRLKAESALAGDPSRMRSALDVVLTQIARLDALVSQLLAMTQRREAVARLVETAGFLREAADEFRDLAAARDVRLAVDAAELTGRFDRELARRALGNLVLNAIQHTPEGGVVTLSCTLTDAWLRFAVADTGAGVAPSVRDTLFEPFVTGRPDGTGLGLALAREFAEAQGGRVRLLSPGGDGDAGAVFALELPWRPS